MQPASARVRPCWRATHPRGLSVGSREKRQPRLADRRCRVCLRAALKLTGDYRPPPPPAFVRRSRRSRSSRMACAFASRRFATVSALRAFRSAFVASSFENRALRASNMTAPPSRCRSTLRVVVSRGKQAHRSFRLPGALEVAGQRVLQCARSASCLEREQAFASRPKRDPVSVSSGTPAALAKETLCRLRAVTAAAVDQYRRGGGATT
jgi:hypothetical protein